MLARLALSASAVLLVLLTLVPTGFAQSGGSDAGSEQPTPEPEQPEPEQPVDPANPCLGPLQRELLCPDLRMTPPYDLRIDKSTRRGRTLLRAANSINSRGEGPAELFGTRRGPNTMTATQKIWRRGGGKATYRTGAKLGFKSIPGQYRYWKYTNAARFEIWEVDDLLRPTRLVRTGPKVYYCLRDLRRTRAMRGSPRRYHYPACSQRRSERNVTLGTSVGWSDIYPASYHEQWIDVTGLRGTYAFKHIADPENGIWENDEANNEGVTIVRLPSGRSVRSGSAGDTAPEYDKVDAP